MKRFLYVIGVAALVVFLITSFTYIPSLKNEFVNWDDDKYVYENINIQFLNFNSLHWMLTTFHASNWHPLTWLSHALDFALFGLNPLGHHLTNIILHGLNTLLLFLLVIRLYLRAQGLNTTPSPLPLSTRSLMAAGVTALLFGLHPLHVESVAWVAERKDLLCAFFVFSTILSYLSFTSSGVGGHRRAWCTTCLLLFILALMSKPMAVTLPLVLLLLDHYPLRRMRAPLSKNLSVLREKVPFFALSIASGIITIAAQHSGEALRSLAEFPLPIRLLNAARALVFYLEKMVIPFTLVPFYPFPAHIHWWALPYLLSMVLIAVITGWCLWMMRQRRAVWFTVWAYYLVTLLPVLGIIQVGGQAAADRYTYIPSVSIFLMGGIGALWLFERARVRGGERRGVLVLLLVACLLSSLGYLTIRQITIWHHSENLWSYVTKVFPKSIPFAHFNLADAYARKGALDKAISEYKYTLILAPPDAEVFTNLGSVYGRKGMFDEAILECKKAIALNPYYAKSYGILGSVYASKGMLNESIVELKKALALNNHDAEAHFNLGLTYDLKGMLDDAIYEYHQATTINPNYAKAHYNLAVAYFYKKNYTLATIHCFKSKDLGYRVKQELLNFLKTYR